MPAGFSSSSTSSDSAARRGVRLGVDVGTVRVGVAVSDPDGILATPVTTLARDEVAARDIEDLATMVAERSVVEVAVGLPRTLRGADGAAAQAARRYASALAERVAPVPVVLVDERLSSVHANRVFDERKVSGRARRAVVDQLAAVTILQTHLDGIRHGAAGSAAARDRGGPGGAHG